MSTTVWPFQFFAPEVGGQYTESQRPVDEIGKSLGGKTAVLNRAADREYSARGWVVLPDDAGNDPSTFDDYVETMDGRVDTFLYRAQRARHRQVVAGSLGTGDAATVAFLFSGGTKLHKFIIASTLKVYVSGALQTAGGVDYTFSGNNVAPLVTFAGGSVPGGAAPITVSYEFYQSVRFARTDFPTRFMASDGDYDLTTQEAVRLQVELVEDYPGARFA